MTAMRHSYFRPHATPEPRDWPLWAVLALGVFDVWMLVLLAINSWAIYKS